MIDANIGKSFRVALLAGTALFAMPAYLHAQATATRPAAVTPSRPDPAVDKILDRLEAKNIKDIECKIVYVKEDPVFNGKEEFAGTLLFKEDKPNPLFHIRFDTSTQNGRVANKKEWHVFDGRWYIEAREKTKSIVKHEILAQGQQRQLFRLGQGPFPLPFGQKKADIIANLSVKLVPADAKDPPNSDHLECKPLPGTDIDKKYDTIHFWIDRTKDMPVRVRTIEKAEGNQITASFSNEKINSGMPGSRLALPDLPDYSITEDQIPANGKPAGKK